MTRNEWEAMVQGFSGNPVGGDIEGLLRTILASSTTPSGAAQQPDAVKSAAASGPSSTAQGSGRESESSTAAEVVRTIGMVTGVGPVITGLLKLFGSGDEPSSGGYSPVPFSLPEQVSVEAGLTGERTFAEIGYNARGLARTLPPPQPASSSSGAQIQINVNAMDSRSFADHSDEIARAVREAMLRSHSLNDVIAEV